MVVRRRAVTAGPVVAELEGPDLRYVRAGGVEIARRVYAAVRDCDWGTAQPKLDGVRLDVQRESFELAFDARNSEPALDVDFSWHGTIVGSPDGSLTLTLDGVAESDMRYSRIGWCVLHPDENAGRRYRAHAQGRVVEGTLPLEIGPQLFVDGVPVALFPAFDRLDVEVHDGLWAQFEFEGARFEIEDQRNWADASFKTYSAPTQPHQPHTARAGERIRQSVRISVSGDIPAAADPGRTTTLRLFEARHRLPAVGVGAASHEVDPTGREQELLRAASLDHVRVDVDLAVPDWRRSLRRGVTEAQALDTPLELAVILADDDDQLVPLAAALRDERVTVSRVLAFHHAEAVSSAKTVARVRAVTEPTTGTVPVVGGTNVYFTDINRQRPDLAAVAGVAWPIAATVHATDDVSVLETATVQGTMVQSARAFCDTRTLHATPVTFNPRFNPNASGALAKPAAGELPPQVDVRQPSLLAAAWTVASLSHLAAAGVDSVTYFETTGRRGLIESQARPAAPGRFASWPGMVFPVYHVLADVGEWKGGEVVATSTSPRFAVAALAVRAGDALHVLVASCSPEPQECRLEGLPSGPCRLRTLDEDSFALACSEPEAFRAATRAIDVGETLPLQLAPYAVVRLDCSR